MGFSIASCVGKDFFTLKDDVTRDGKEMERNKNSSAKTKVVFIQRIDRWLLLFRRLRRNLLFLFLFGRLFDERWEAGYAEGAATPGRPVSLVGLNTAG